MAYEILLDSKALHGIQPISYDDEVHPYTDLLAGRLDAVLLDHIIANRAMRRVQGLVTHPDAVATGHYVGVLAPGSEVLRDRINAILLDRLRDGTPSASSALGVCGMNPGVPFRRASSRRPTWSWRARRRQANPS